MIETMERIQMKCHKVSIVIGGGSDVTMVSGWELGSLLLVSVLWGVTNPFLRKGAEGLEVVKEKRTLRQLLSETRFLICNYRYVIPFLLNQSGSVVFYLTLASAGAVLGLFLTILGITLCVASSVND
ncbi:transmembrane protein 234 isoform 3-T3 [Discoglossus pictus]